MKILVLSTFKIILYFFAVNSNININKDGGHPPCNVSDDTIECVYLVSNLFKFLYCGILLNLLIGNRSEDTRAVKLSQPAFIIDHPLLIYD